MAKKTKASKPDFVRMDAPPGLTAKMYADLVKDDATTFLKLYLNDPAFLYANYKDVFVAIRAALVAGLAPIVETIIQDRYANGVCRICKGKASACAKRHVRGMSCG